MLKQRILTALLLLAVLLPATFHASPYPFVVVTLVLLSAGAWEWARLNAMGATACLATAGICAALCGLSWYLGIANQPLVLVWLAAGCIWVLGGAWVLRGGVIAWQKLPRGWRWFAGVLLLWGAWIAIVQARAMGINFLLSVLALVWAADVGAYFAGRSLGGKFFANKLAPAISPGKTWEGVCGGGMAVVLLALLWLYAAAHWLVDSPSIYSRLAAMGHASLLVGLAFLLVMSVVGDLLESLFKRSAGVKDSSHLLPGHGGVLDRLDALLPTLPLAMMLVSASSW
ncbi:MAG: phosphatidate cytidylyltransferase [Rhodoferax sp.]|nr:phosphatidate cytidylyltransferase [Rhodoferax sp.]